MRFGSKGASSGGARGDELRLENSGRTRIVEGGGLRVVLDDEWNVLEAAGASFEGPRSLRPAAEMAILYEGITGSLSFLLIE